MASSVEDAEEEDFMSDAFLVQAEKAASTTTTSSYSERRRKQLNAAHDNGKTVSRAERERLARQQGLERNLIGEHEGRKRKNDEDQCDGGATDDKKRKQQGHPGESKALRMMLAMGFTPGEALGKQGDEITAAPSNDPIALDERWLGARRRAGIGRLPPASAVAMHADIAAAADKHASSLAAAGHDTRLDAASADFRARAREQNDVRHAEALLSRARKTCHELDVSQLDMTYSPLWLNPQALSKRTDELPKHIAELIEFAFAGLDAVVPEVAGDAEERKPAVELDSAPDDAAGESAKESTRVGDEKDKNSAIARTDEAKRFCSLPAVARLQITQSHLRRAHHYCLYCGHRYDSTEDLDATCPGEEEDDH